MKAKLLVTAIAVVVLCASRILSAQVVEVPPDDIEFGKEIVAPADVNFSQFLPGGGMLILSTSEERNRVRFNSITYLDGNRTTTLTLFGGFDRASINISTFEGIDGQGNPIGTTEEAWLMSYYAVHPIFIPVANDGGGFDPIKLLKKHSKPFYDDEPRIMGKFLQLTDENIVKIIEKVNALDGVSANLQTRLRGFITLYEAFRKENEPKAIFLDKDGKPLATTPRGQMLTAWGKLKKQYSQ